MAEAIRPVNAGSDALQAPFNIASPCLIVIDEWIAYVRQCYDMSGLPLSVFCANLHNLGHCGILALSTKKVWFHEMPQIFLLFPGVFLRSSFPN